MLKPRNSRGNLFHLLLLGFIGFLMACGDETLVLESESPTGGSSESESTDMTDNDERTSDLDAPETGTPEDAGEGTTDADSAEVLYPDEAAFEMVVLPILVSRCGAGCHLYPVDLSNNETPAGNHFEFDPDDIAQSIEEFIHPAHITPNDPESSEIIVHHAGMYYRSPDEKRAVREWIADTLVPKVEEMEEEEMGASQVPCELIPSNDGIGPDGWFAEFETTINPMLVGTPEQPEGYCSGGGCHTETGAGDELTYLPATDVCSAKWNFLVSQNFVTFNEPSASPLLRKPLGEDCNNANVCEHGGRQVFFGMDDNYILLRNWLALLMTQ